MKRGVLFFTAALMLLLLLPSPISAGDFGCAELYILAPEAAPPAGESFEVTLELRGNPGIYSFGTVLLYDGEAVECTRIEPGPVMAGMLSVTNPRKKTVSGAYIGGAASNEQKSDGVLAVFSFTTLKDDAAVPRTLYETELAAGNDGSCPYDIIQCDENGTELSSYPGSPTSGPAGKDPEEGPTAPDDDRDDDRTEPDGERDDDRDEGRTGPDTDADEGRQAVGNSEDVIPSFTDIDDHPYKENIVRSAALGLFLGYPDGTFRPDENVTRAQFVTVLWRMAGKPYPSRACPFGDVAGDAWYYDAVAWAYEAGFISGRSRDVFDPQGNITRQEATKILFAFSGGVSGTEMLFASVYDGSFSDSGKIAAWAKAAVYWGYYNGIIRENGSSELRPRDSATRAELADALVLYREKYPI